MATDKVSFLLKKKLGKYIYLSLLSLLHTHLSLNASKSWELSPPPSIPGTTTPSASATTPPREWDKYSPKSLTNEEFSIFLTRSICNPYQSQINQKYALL